MIKVKYLYESNPLTLKKGKIYVATILQNGWYSIVDETGEEWSYQPELFEIVDTMNEPVYMILDDTIDVSKEPKPILCEDIRRLKEKHIKELKEAVKKY